MKDKRLGSKQESIEKWNRKCRTGIQGLDEITNGGVPEGRTTLVCGAAGCGKTVLGIEFLVQGATVDTEPGLFVSFEEDIEELQDNFHSMGIDLPSLCKQHVLNMIQVELAREQIIEAGTFSLEPLFIRIAAAIKQVSVKRVVLDTLDTLFSVFEDTRVLRQEIVRLFHWLKEAGVTTVITGEKGDDRLTRIGFEEYVSDCVILLDHRIETQISKRRLRVIKYRGSSHSSDEYPFLINDHGFQVFPITSTGLNYIVNDERISTGFKDLDDMFGGLGYYRRSTVLASGKAGTGKSSLAASFAAEVCRNGEKVVYFAFEESESQIIRNMSSAGIDLKTWVEHGLLNIQAFRPTSRGMEEHLVAIMHIVETVKPTCVVIDPVSNFISVGTSTDVKAMLTRAFDYLKNCGITLFITALTPGLGIPEETQTDVSSIVDTWIALDQKRLNSSHHRELYIIKSRGMSHSHESRGFIISDNGLRLTNPPAKQVPGKELADKKKGERV